MRVSITTPVEAGFSRFSGIGFIQSFRYVNHYPAPPKDGSTPKFAPKVSLVAEAVVVELDVEHKATDNTHTLRWGCGGKSLEETVVDGKALPFRMCPGTSRDRNDLDAQPMGTEVGAEGNCLYPCHESCGLHPSSPMYIFGQSLIKSGMSKDGVEAGQAEEFVGMIAKFNSEERTMDDGKKYQISVVEQIIAAPNVLDWRAATKAAPPKVGLGTKPATKVAAPATKVTPKVGVVPAAKVPVPAAKVAAPPAADVDDGGAKVVEAIQFAVAAGKFVSGTSYDQNTFRTAVTTAVLTNPAVVGPDRLKLSQLVAGACKDNWQDLCAAMVEITDSAVMDAGDGTVIAV